MAGTIGIISMVGDQAKVIVALPEMVAGIKKYVLMGFPLQWGAH